MSKMRMLLGIALGAGAIGATSAQGAVMVIGSSQARGCYEAAKFGHPTEPSLEVCKQALDGALNVRDRAATLVNRGIIHMRAGTIDYAIKDYDAALALMPELAEAYVDKGIALVHAGDNKGAITMFDRGLALEPGEPEIAYYSRGIAHELAGDVRAAYFDYSRAADLKPEWNEPKAQLSRFTVRKAG